MSDEFKSEPEISLTTNTAPNDKAGVHVIHNSMYILTRSVIVVANILVLVFVLFNIPEHFVMFLLISIPVFLFYIFSIKAQWHGVIVDITNNKLTYPGGAISANEFSQYFSKNFLLQKFKRFEVNISDIKNIKSEQVEKLCLNKYYYPAVSIVGSFGSASIIFNEEGKRDQLFAILREANNMGSPVINVR